MKTSLKDLNFRIDSIEKVLSKNTSFFEEKGVNLGISNGILGISLFYYYYYLLTKKQDHLDLILEYLNKSFSGLNRNYQGSFIILDMVEMAKYLYFLKQEEIIEDDIGEYCNEFDPWLNKFLIDRKSAGDLEPYGGMIRAGYYFLQRSDEIDVSKPINEILDFIEGTVTWISSDMILFNYEFIHKGKGTNQLGKGHGIAGIIYFILHVYLKGLFVERCKKLLTPAINFLLTRKIDTGVNLFHYDLYAEKSLNYSNLSYGDLGIAYVIYFAGRKLGIPKYVSESVSIINNIAKFRDDDFRYLKDANLRYGAAGNFSIFKILETYVPSKEVKNAKEYWMSKILRFNNNNTPWAGYDTFFNGDLPEMQLSFDKGICGIGITLICEEMGIAPKYMSFLNYNFV